MAAELSREHERFFKRFGSMVLFQGSLENGDARLLIPLDRRLSRLEASQARESVRRFMAWHYKDFSPDPRAKFEKNWMLRDVSFVEQVGKLGPRARYAAELVPTGYYGRKMHKAWVKFLSGQRAPRTNRKKIVNAF